jgi:hypothetical protein
MKDLKEVALSINRLLNDIKAEVVASNLIENEVNPADIVIFPDGAFRRNYSRDINYAEVTKLENGQQVLGIHITRDGIYDSLPEAVFHDQSSDPLISGHDMAKLSKKQKKEEKEARLFFLPLENEIFYQRIQLEIEERKLLYRFSENLFDDIYPQFWNLDRTLPRKLVSRFVLILHLTHKILGNPELTAKCLEVILEEEVKINISRKSLKEKDLSGINGKKKTGLGSCVMGEDFICGSYVSEYDTVMEFVIGPLKNSSIEDFLENGSYSRFLSCFYSFFVPIEMEAVTIIKANETRQHFVLNDSSSNVILGYNSSI